MAAWLFWRQSEMGLKEIKEYLSQRRGTTKDDLSKSRAPGKAIWLATLATLVHRLLPLFLQVPILCRYWILLGRVEWRRSVQNCIRIEMEVSCIKWEGGILRYGTVRPAIKGKTSWSYPQRAVSRELFLLHITVHWSNRSAYASCSTSCKWMGPNNLLQAWKPCL